MWFMPVKVKIHPHCKEVEENIFLIDDGDYIMELSEKDIMLVLVAAKTGGIYLDVDKLVYSQAINDALQVIAGSSECGSYDRVEDLLGT